MIIGILIGPIKEEKRRTIYVQRKEWIINKSIFTMKLEKDKRILTETNN